MSNICDKTYKNTCLYAQNHYKIWRVYQFGFIFAALKGTEVLLREG